MKNLWITTLVALITGAASASAFAARPHDLCRAPRTKSFSTGKSGKSGFAINATVDDGFVGPTGDACSNCTLNNISIQGQVTLPPGAKPEDYKVITFLKVANDIWYIQPNNNVVPTFRYPDGSKNISDVIDGPTEWGPGISNEYGSVQQFSYSEIEEDGYFKTHIGLKDNTRYSSVAFVLVQKGALQRCTPGGVVFFRDYVKYYRLTSRAQAVYDFGCFNKVPAQN